MNRTWLVSYPRSGNTWMRFLLANILYPDEDVNYNSIHTLIPDSHQVRDWEGRMVVKSHYCLRPDYEKVIYLYRDGRDVILSCYHYYQGDWMENSEFQVVNMSFTEYLRKFIEGWNPFGNWKNHMEVWLHQMRGRVKTFMISYEDLSLQTQLTVEQTLRFLNINADKKLISDTIKKCKFACLQCQAFSDKVSMPKQGRLGKPGGWKKEFSQSDLDLFWNWAGDLMKELNYKYEGIK